MTNNGLRSVNTDGIDEFRQASLPGLPKYAQLREMLVAAISAGRWKAGDKLPAETDLVRLAGFSLGTVQRALRALVDEGLVVRTQGSGTFVTNGRGPIDEPLHLRFLGEAGEPRFLPIFPKMITRKRVTQRGPWSHWLQQEGADIVRIDRRLSVSGEFNVFNRLYFNANTFPHLAEQPLESLDGVSLKQLLSSALNMPITNVRQCALLVTCAPHICNAIGIGTGTHAMLLESAASAGRANPVYFLESFIPPTHRRLYLLNE
ncbi:MAG: GntR family transcriptional regulator [Pseudomonadota bacterium]